MILVLGLVACGPTDPWDDPEYVRRQDLRSIPIEVYEAHYPQIARRYDWLGCHAGDRFYEEPRPAAVRLLLDEIRSASHPEACARNARPTFYRVCDALCSSNPDPHGFAPCDASALATMPEGCQWIAMELVPLPNGKAYPKERWLKRPFPWRPGSIRDTRHPPEAAQHYAEDAEFQAILRAHDATKPTP